MNAQTVQDAVGGAICRLDGAPRRLSGASRTDAGVHARGQVANFHTDSAIPADKYAYALNTVLPAGAVCVKSFEADPQFHARFSAKGKEYSYLILNRRQPSALYRHRAWHVPLPLDVDVMRDAAGLFVGEHDFRAFMSTGSPVKSTIRSVTRLDIEEINLYTPPCPFVRISIEGNGFLYNMVRIVTGTLVYAGQGRLNLDDVKHALCSGDRRAAGKTAPPHGLCLEQVFY
jgi:tRNA pseudouridine38-40 synthase